MGQQSEGEGGDGHEGSDRQLVAGLLQAAGLNPPPEEVDRLTELYPALRRSLDRFHAVDVGDEVAAAVFRAGELG